MADFVEVVTIIFLLKFVCFLCNVVITERQRKNRNPGGYSGDLQFSSKFLSLEHKHCIIGLSFVAQYEFTLRQTFPASVKRGISSCGQE